MGNYTHSPEVRVIPPHKANDPLKIRTVPFGPPPTRDNTEWNPGRQRFAANNGTSYATFEGRNFYFLNRGRYINKDDPWQSGPTNNNLTNDHFTKGAGFWTSPGGTNWNIDNGWGSNPGNSHKEAGFTLTTNGKNDGNGIFLYDLGHSTKTSAEEGSPEYGCIGFSAYMHPHHDPAYNDDQGKGRTSKASIGLRHAYCMYRSDATDQEVEDAKQLLEDLLGAVKDTSDFLVDEVPDEIQETYVDGKFDDEFEDLDLLRPFLARGLYDKFEKTDFKYSNMLGPILQILAETILNSKGKDVSDYSFIINDFVEKAKKDGSIDGIDIFDYLVRLCVADDSFVQENPDYFSLRNVMNPIYDFDKTVVDERSKEFIVDCFLNDGVAVKDEETGEWTCSYEDINGELEFMGPTGPYIVSAYTSSQEFQDWCDANEGEYLTGTKKQCYFDGTDDPFKEDDYEKGIVNFTDWCTEQSGKSTIYQETIEHPEFATCEVTYNASSQLPFKTWCQQEGGTIKVTTNGDECVLPGAQINMKQSDYDKDIGGFLNWCNKNTGEYEFFEDKNTATCEFTVETVTSEYFEGWCTSNGGSPQVIRDELTCTFMQYENMTETQFNNFPNGFIDWCVGNDGAVSNSSQGQDGLQCIVGTKSPIVNFDTWCRNLGGIIQNNGTSSKYCKVPNVPQPEFSERRYNSNDIDQFRDWCINQNQGTAQVRTPSPGRTDLYCNVDYTQTEGPYTVEDMCNQNGGIFQADLETGNDYCMWPYLLDYENAEHHQKGDRGFDDWCYHTRGELKLDIATNALRCDISASTLEPLRDWCNTYDGTYTDLGDKGKRTNSESYCRLPGLSWTLTYHYYRSTSRFLEWCGIVDANVKVGPNESYIDATVRGSTTRTYRYIPKTYVDYNILYDENYNIDNESNLNLTQVIPYEIIDNPQQDVFAHLGIPNDTGDTEYKLYTYQGKGQDEEQKDLIVYPLIEADSQSRGRRAYFSSQTLIEPDWRAYPGNIYEDHMPPNSTYQVSNLSKYEITVWTSIDNGRTWQREGVADSPSKANTVEGIDNKVVLTDRGVEAKVRYSASNAPSFNETVEDFKPNGKEVDVEFGIHLEGNIPKTRRAYHQDTFSDDPIWDLYGTTATSVPYTDVIELNSKYKISIDKTVWTENDFQYISIYTSEDGNNNTYSLESIIGWKKAVIQVESSNQVVDGLSGLQEIAASATIEYKKNDDGSTSGRPYIRYAISEELSKIEERYFLPDGMEIPLKFEKQNEDPRETGVRYYWSPARNTKPDLSKYQLLEPIAFPSSWLGSTFLLSVMGVAGMEIEVWGTNVTTTGVPSTSKPAPKPSDLTKLHTFPATGPHSNFAVENLRYRCLYLIAPNPSKYKQDDFLPNGRPIEYGVTKTFSETPKAYFTESENKEPDWTRYEYIWTPHKTDNQKISIENKSKYKIVIWGADEENYLAGNWTRIDSLKALGAPQDERVYEYEGIEYNYFRYAAGDAKTKFNESFRDYHDGYKEDVTPPEPIKTWGKDVDVKHVITQKSTAEGRRAYWQIAVNSQPDFVKGGFYTQPVYSDTLLNTKFYTLTNRSKYVIQIWANIGSNQYVSIGTMDPNKTFEVRGDQYNSISYGAADANSKYHESIGDFVPDGKEVEITLTSDDLGSKIKRVLYQQSPEESPLFELYDNFNSAINPYTDKILAGKKYTFTNLSTVYDIDLWAADEDGQFSARYTYVGTAYKVGSGASKPSIAKFNSTVIKDGKEINYAYLRYGARNGKDLINGAPESGHFDYTPIGKEFDGDLIGVDSAPELSKNARAYFETSAGTVPDWSKFNNNLYEERLLPNKEYTYKNLDDKYDLDAWLIKQSPTGVQSIYLGSMGRTAATNTIVFDVMKDGYDRLRFGAANSGSTGETINDYFNVTGGDGTVRDGKEVAIEQVKVRNIPVRGFLQDRPNTKPNWDLYDRVQSWTVPTSEFGAITQVKNFSKYEIQLWGTKSNQTDPPKATYELVGTCKGHVAGKQDHIFELNSATGYTLISFGVSNGKTAFNEDESDGYLPIGKDIDIRFTVTEGEDPNQEQPTGIKSYWCSEYNTTPNWSRYSKPIFSERTASSREYKFLEFTNNEDYSVRLGFFDIGAAPDTINKNYRYFSLLPGQTVAFKNDNAISRNFENWPLPEYDYTGVGYATLSDKQVYYQAMKPSAPESDWPAEGKDARIKFEIVDTPTNPYWQQVVIHYSSARNVVPNLQNVHCYYVEESSRSNSGLPPLDYDWSKHDPEKEDYFETEVQILYDNASDLTGDIQVWWSKKRNPRVAADVMAGPIISKGETLEDFLDDTERRNGFTWMFITSIGGEGFDSDYWDPFGNVFNLELRLMDRYGWGTSTPKAMVMYGHYSHHQHKFPLHRDYDNELSRLYANNSVIYYDLRNYGIDATDPYFVMVSAGSSKSYRIWGTNNENNFKNLTTGYGLKYDITNSNLDVTQGFGTLGVIPYGSDSTKDPETVEQIFPNTYRYILLQAISPNINYDYEEVFRTQYPKIPYKNMDNFANKVEMANEISELYSINGDNERTARDIKLAGDGGRFLINKYDTIRNGVPTLRAYTAVNDSTEKLTHMNLGAFTYFKGKADSPMEINPSFKYNDYHTYRGPTVSRYSGIYEAFDILKYNSVRVTNPFPYELQIRLVGHLLPERNGDPFTVRMVRESTNTAGDPVKRAEYEWPYAPKLVYDAIVHKIPAKSSKTINVADLYDNRKYDRVLTNTTTANHTGYQRTISYSPLFVKVINSGAGSNSENFYTINEKTPYTNGEDGNAIRSENIPWEGFWGDIRMQTTATDKEYKKCYWSKDASTVPPVDVWWTNVHKIDLQSLGGTLEEDIFEFENVINVTTSQYVNRNVALWWADPLAAGQPTDNNIEPDGRTKKHFLNWKHHGDILRVGRKLSMKARARYVMLAHYDQSPTLDKQYWHVYDGDGLPVYVKVKRQPNNEVQKGTIYLNNNDAINQEPRWMKYNKPLKYERLTAGNTYDFKNLNNWSIQGWQASSISVNNKVPNGDIKRTVGIPPNTTKRVELAHPYLYWGAYGTGVSTEEAWGLDGRSGNVQVTLVSVGASGATGASGSSGITGSSGSSGIIGGSGSSGIIGSSGDVGGPCKVDKDCPAGFECKNGRCQRKHGSSGIFDTLWDWIGGKPGKPNWKPGKLIKKLFKWIAEILGPLAAEVLAIIAAVLAILKVLSVIGSAVEGKWRALDVIVEANNIEDSNEMKIGGLDGYRDFTSSPGALPDFIANWPPISINPPGLHPILNNQLEDAIEEIKENLPEDIDIESFKKPESHVSSFCHWPQLELKFVNLTINKPMQAATRLLRCRMNGFMFHLSHTSVGRFDDGKLTTRIMKISNLAPTYGFGYTQMRSDNFRKVLRDYNENRVPVGYNEETKYMLDTRYDHIRYDKNWREEDAWFNPVSSLTPNEGHQNPYTTKGGVIHYVGKLGLDVPGEGLDYGCWVNGFSKRTDEDGNDNETRVDPARYMMNVFNSYGAGSKYYSYYNSGTGKNKKKSWTWELMAGEPQKWPVERFGVISEEEGEDDEIVWEGYPGIDFVLTSHDLDQSGVETYKDWQLNFIHLAFEHKKSGERKSIEVWPHPGAINYEHYKFRQSWIGDADAVAAHKMGQLPNQEDYIRLQCTPDHNAQSLINNNWVFWGISTSAWIGYAGGVSRWRSYSFSNLKPMFTPK